MNLIGFAFRIASMYNGVMKIAVPVSKLRSKLERPYGSRLQQGNLSTDGASTSRTGRGADRAPVHTRDT